MTLHTALELRTLGLRFTRLWGRGAVALIVVATSLATAVGQESPPPELVPQSTEQAELVDGLLDLLGDPASRSVDAAAEALTAPRTPPGQSAAEGPGGEDAESDAAANIAAEASLGQHPLIAVHSSMQTAAERLGRGVVGEDTQALQGDILRQLDELIEQLDQQDPAHSSPQQRQQSSTSQSQASHQSAAGASPSADQTASDGVQPEGERQSDSGAGGQNRSAQAGGAADVAVDLADPERLQQDVWGQLPEQMRKQMQSRMVESFLPSYRPQIEAYFRKLLDSEEL